jgi:hypothetical protein
MSNNEIAECCETCGIADVELFGYRNRNTGTWRWFCAAHRIGRWHADARRWPSSKGDDL